MISVLSGSQKTAPSAPTIGTATAGNANASVTFTAPTYTGRSTISSYTVTSSPGGLTGTGASSPITVSGLTNGTAYTFTVTATNAAGLTSAASAASNSVTPIQPTAFNSIASYTFVAPTYGSSITFNSIPQTYKSLQIRIFSTNTDANNTTYQAIAYGTTQTVRSHVLRGNGSSVVTATSTSRIDIGVVPANNSSSSTVARAQTIVDILDYASTTNYKNVQAINGYDSNGGARGQELALYSGSNYANTNAITSLMIYQGNDFTPGSTVCLYGIS
jgi:hypothetical protein